MSGKKTVPHFRSLEADSGSPPDFELGEELGAGGMGVVYAANQTAFGREVAIKMVKPGRKGSAMAADALMAEAVVTGHLEHPNVIPVYDLGVDAEGNLFYAMKEVQGFPWSELMAEKTLDENLDILLRVADTISFAHSRGILHRDLKPHNIMLGEFGETMVMDWGASCAMAGSAEAGALSAESSFCGTPAYMPPEMARGDTNRLGETSDVYLLGAILYHIVSGHPPRREKDPVLCINLASENHIEPVEGDGELLRIAFKAMATAPADRFSSVRKFQQAIREYRAHSESLLLAENAKVHLFRARETKDYDLFSRAIYGFREASELWPENPDAERLRIEAAVEYARCAYDNNDLELAQSLLDPSDPVHRELLDRIARAIRERDAHKKRIRKLLLTARLLGSVLLLIFAAAFFMVRSEQRKTKEEHRQSLVNLVSAYYGEQNYEATVAAFWQLHDQYGMESLDPGTLLDVRVAAAMDPYRGAVDSGVGQPLGTMPSRQVNCVWVVGAREAAKVCLNPNAGYDPATRVAIHDFKFGKRTTPGSVVETVEFPCLIEGRQAFCEGTDGSLWIGSGSKIYCKTSRGWKPVLDTSQLDYPPLPEEYNIDRPAVEKWMASEGRKLPITGILLDRAQTHAAIALGPQTIGWFDLENKQCLGWLAAGHGTYFNRLLRGGKANATLLALSPDEQKLLFRPTTQNQSLVFWFTLPNLVRDAYIYNRDYPVPAIAFSGDNRPRAVLSNSWLFSPNAHFMEKFEREGFYSGKDEDGGRGFPERGETSTLPMVNIRLAAFSKEGSRCCALSRDGLLYVGSGSGSNGFSACQRIARRDIADAYLLPEDCVGLLDSGGILRLYDMRDHALCRVPLEHPVANLCRGTRPENLLATLDLGDSRAIHKIEIDPEGGVKSEFLTSQKNNRSLGCDPLGRYFATADGKTVEVYSFESDKRVFTSSARWTPNLPWWTVDFDKTGKFLYFGGNWESCFGTYETGTWTKLLSPSPSMPKKEREFFCDIVMDWIEGEPVLILAGSNPKKVESHSINPDTLAISTNWIEKTKSTPMAIIPFTAPGSGKRKYWCKLWFQQFHLYDAETGKASVFQNHWERTGIEHPEFISTDPRVVFPKEDGGLEMALKSDLYPIFDPRTLGFKVDQAALNTDATRLYLLDRDGQLHCMELPTLGK